MDQPQRSSPATASTTSRAYQFHPARAAIVNLFDLYLGKSNRSKPEDSVRDPPNKAQKRVLAINRELPPRNEQFILDFEQIKNQFPDHDQLRALTESVLISLVVQCSGHVPRAEFLLFALRILCGIGYINWDTFLPSLLSSVSSAEVSVGQGSQATPTVSSTNLSQAGVLPSSNQVPNSSTFQSSNPASPLPSVHGISSPAQSSIDPSCTTLSPIKSPDLPGTGLPSAVRVTSFLRNNAISSLRQLCCKIILSGLQFNLKPGTHADIFSHMLNWMVNWDQRQQGVEESENTKSWRPDKALIEWLHSCLDVVWLLVEENKCRVPFYELLRSGLQFIDNIPDDEALFTLILEIHRRRDMMAMHMQMLDQHLHSPTFGTQRIFSQTMPNISGEPTASLRYSPITYPSVLGEPLHGEDIASAIQRGTRDWERAMRCIRHALRTTPSPDWWKRALLVAPGYRSPAHGLTPGAVFTSEMICEATIDRIFELLKLTNSDIDNVSKLSGTSTKAAHCWSEVWGKQIAKSAIYEGEMNSSDGWIVPLSKWLTEESMLPTLSSKSKTLSGRWSVAKEVLGCCWWMTTQFLQHPLNFSRINMNSQSMYLDNAFEMVRVGRQEISSLAHFIKILSQIHCWQEWLVFSDIFFFLMKSGCIDFADFVAKLFSRVTEGGHHVLRTNHVTWLFAQIIRVELVMSALNSDARKVETTRKILSFHREDKSADPNNPQSILLDFISSCQNLRIWSLNTTTREYLNNEQLQKGKQIDEWWRHASKGDRMMDYMSMDDKSIGMFWVVSYTMAQPACETVMNWLSSAGVPELSSAQNLQNNDRMMVMREVSPLPMSLLSGFSMNLCSKLTFQMEESLFSGQVVPSIALAETYTRLLLLAPYSLFRSHFNHLAQKNPSLLSKPGVTLLVLEILNYRLLPLYRYQGKSKALMYDVTKIVSALKGKRGDHRVFRLAENLCMNLIFSLRDFFFVKREGKGPTEFTETLNRLAVVTLAILIKTRGIHDADHLLYLQTMLEQTMATSQHTWSEKTLRHFPPILREALIGRIDKRGVAIQAWQQAETTVINQCNQLLSPSADPTYVMTYISHSFPQHKQYLCAGAWILMQGHPERINSTTLARVLREFSPEEVTANIYTMVDVLLHHIQMEPQHGHSTQDILLKVCANLSFFVWNQELLPLDILLLAFIDRDDDPNALRIVINLLDRQELQQRVKLYCISRGSPEHWLHSAVFKRNDLQKALGNHLSWKDRYPVFFDDIAARLLPVIPLIVYRLIENDAVDQADRLLAMYSPFLAYHPLRFTFVRDILSYFYGLLPNKLIVRILYVLDISKIPFSESFPQHISSTAPVMCPPMDYFATLLLGLVNNVIPSLQTSKSGTASDTSSNPMRPSHNKAPGTTPPGATSAPESQKAFYQIQDPGTYTQLVLETAVIELLSLPVSADQIVPSLVQIVVNIQPTLIQSSNNLHVAPSSMGQGSALPTSPSGGSTDSLNAGRSNTSVSGINTPNFVSRSGYTCQQLSSLMIQACGLLLAQLPQEFHVQLYLEASRIIKETWWLSDATRSLGELNSAVGYSLMDPTWAAQDNTSTAIGNTVALLHSLFSNLPQEWLEGAHVIIKHLRPVSSVAMLRIVFRIMGPLLPKLANAHTLFCKTLSSLLSIMVDMFGKNSQTSITVEAAEISDLIDFLHHVVHYEGQGGPVVANSKPRQEVLAIIGRALENLRPDVQHLLSHLKPDTSSSIYAATQPKQAQNPS